MIRWLVITLFGVIALAALVVFGARFADGPLGMLPGGPLTSGEWVEKRDVDWSFAADIQEIELESDGRSRTTWILVKDGEAYVPASLSFPPGKTWHIEALAIPDAVVRVDGKRYRRRLERVEDPDLKQQLRERVVEKYTPPPGGGDAWFFRLGPPA